MISTPSFTINNQTGLLQPVIYRASSHCDDRPPQIAINLIVIHGISLPPGEFGTTAIEEFFCGKLNYSAHSFFATIAHLRVASHLLIKRSGDIIQFVPFNKRAWHAGESCFQGQSHCNDFSIGIELEGTDEIPYEANQYEQLKKIIVALRQTYPGITEDRIVGHADIAPNRKTDPGRSFDWNKL